MKWLLIVKSSIDLFKFTKNVNTSSQFLHFSYGVGIFVNLNDVYRSFFVSHAESR